MRGFENADFSLSSRRGRRGLGRGGSSCSWLFWASAGGGPSPQPSPRSFLTGRGSPPFSLSCGLLSNARSGLLLIATATCLVAAPVIKHASPSAIAPGQTTEVTFFGSELDGATSLWTSFDAKAEKIRCSPDQAVFRISLPKHCGIGLGAVRLAATNGVSSLHLVMIDGLAGVAANGTNHSPATAQTLKPPVAVDGVCEDKTSDFFKVVARKGQNLSFEVVAQRLGSALDPLARLFDSSGRELVFCEDTPGAGVDCRFNYRFARSGEYLLELRDTRYDGGRQHRYRLRVGDLPSEPMPLPFHVKPEFDQPVSLLREIAEVEPNDSTPQKISIPACIKGRFTKANDRDRFQFEARSGERLVFHSLTRSLGSPCDLYLRLETADGKKLAESPMTGPEESSLTNTFKEAGAYQLVVEEAAQLGGLEYFYRLEIEPFRPGFGLSVETDKVQAASGGSVAIKVSQERHGYDGPITLALAGVGDGFGLETNVLTVTTNATPVTLKLPAGLEPGQLVNFRMTGHAKIDGKEFEATVSTRPALRKLFPHLPWPPVALDGWMALGVTSK